MRKLLVCLLLTGLILFLHLYRIDQRYVFDWDQEDDALKVTEMIRTKKPLLIGPRVANENGFFVGPYHYYFLSIFYTAMKGDPRAGVAAGVVVLVMTSWVVYWVGGKLYGERVGIIGGVLVAFFSTLVCWNAMYAGGLGVFGYYLCVKAIESEDRRYFLGLMSMAGLCCTIHLVPASIMLSVVTVALLAVKRLDKKTVVEGVLLFLLSFIPIIIFDLRHDLLNSKKIIEFFLSPQQGEGMVNRWLFMRTYWRGLDWLGLGRKFFYLRDVWNILILVIVGWEIYGIRSKRIKLLTLVWVLTPGLLIFYKGNISEYYYGMSWSIFPVLIASFISRVEVKWGLLIMLVLGGIKFDGIMRAKAYVSLVDKEKVVRCLVSQTRDPYFNVGYDLGLGMDTGYRYLFKYCGKEPFGGPEGHLYKIGLLPYFEEGELVCKSNNLGVIRK